MTDPHQDPELLRAGWECLRYIAESSAMDDWEFQTRLGVEREDVRSRLVRWPLAELPTGTSDDALAVSNCFNEVCHGLRISEAEWSRWFTLSRKRSELRTSAILRWSSLPPGGRHEVGAAAPRAGYPLGARGYSYEPH